MKKSIYIYRIFLASFFTLPILFTLNFVLQATKSINVNLDNPSNEFEYKVQDNLKPKDLVGISNEQIEDHWKLYQGYVKQVNTLNNELKKMREENKGDSLDYSDRRRRFGFEYNGMVLHEYYFGNLCSKPSDITNGELLRAIKKHFGSFEKWKDDFKNAGKTRGIGWVILFMDPINGNLINAFIQDHEIGNITSFKPILVMDVWEHAYMVDFFAGERGNYIDAFIKNINWTIVENRFSKIN